MVTFATYINAPTTTPLRGRLLDVAQVTDDFQWLDGEALFDSYNCMKFQAEPVFCAPNTKTFDQVSGWQDGFLMGAYGGTKCRAVGLDKARQLSEVERVFTAGESTAVERGLMKYRFVASTNNWAVPTDITPAGGAVAPKVGIALLEAHAANNYVGVPTLHIPRVIASLATQGDFIEYDGNGLRTPLGSKVAAGAGYDFPNTSPTGAAAATGEKWLYATGEVAIGRGPIEVRQAIDQTNNDVYVLGERPYIVAVDCYAAAIKVTVTA